MLITTTRLFVVFGLNTALLPTVNETTSHFYLLLGEWCRNG